MKRKSDRKGHPRGAQPHLVAAFLSTVLGVNLLGAPARAEGGELLLHLAVVNQTARVRHPDASYPDGDGSWIYVPRIEFSADYGLAHWLSFGFGGNLSLSRDVTAGNVAVQDLPKGDLAAQYMAIMLPASATLHFSQGGDWSTEVVARGGPVFYHWQVDTLRSPSGARLPLEPRSDWYKGWFGGLALLAQWRPGDWAAVSAGPYGEMSTVGDIYVGVVVEGALAFGAGPFLK
jgi:hypothetical protein